MNTATTLATYAAGLAAVFGSAVGVGNAVGPVGPGSDSSMAAHSTDGGSASGAHGDDHSGSGAGTAAPLPVADGLSVSRDGYTLLLEQAPTAAGRAQPLSFRILGPEGAAVTEYALEHDKELHLVLVRRDTTGFQHLHPARDAAGRWSLPVTLPAAGTYKVFTDFTPAGVDDGLTLATDLTVPGAVQTLDLPTVQRTATVDDYTVTLTGDLEAGASSPLTLQVSKAGRPVTDLQPYLGAYGHLVALREGDLAYLHVHPEGDEPAGATGGPEIAFAADVPSAGDYRLFLDFQHDGVVRTAAFGLRTATRPATATSAPAASPQPPASGVPHTDGGHGS